MTVKFTSARAHLYAGAAVASGVSEGKLRSHRIQPVDKHRDKDLG